MRPLHLAGPVVALLAASSACTSAAGPELAGLSAAQAALATEQASARALRVLGPMVQRGLLDLEAARAADLGRLHIPSLDGVEADQVLDALAAAVEGRPPDSGLDLAGAWFLARVRAYRLRARTPGLAWGGGFRPAALSTGPSPVERAEASLLGVEESARALQSELTLASHRRANRTATR